VPPVSVTIGSCVCGPFIDASRETDVLASSAGTLERRLASRAGKTPPGPGFTRVPGGAVPRLSRTFVRRLPWGRLLSAVSAFEWPFLASYMAATSRCEYVDEGEGDSYLSAGL